MTSKVFFIYLDWTLEKIPRRFYVGKGCYNRVHNKNPRNPYWASIAKKYGLRREVVLATLDETFSFIMEKSWIAEYGTFENGLTGRWGANLTEGGEGPSGLKHTLIAKEKNRLAHLGKSNPAANQKISQRLKGRPAHNKGTTVSRSTLVKMCDAQRKRKNKNGPSVATAVKIGDANRGKIPWNKGQSGKSKLTWDDVNLMRELATNQSWLVSELAVRFDMTSVNVRNILTFKTWKLSS